MNIGYNVLEISEPRLFPLLAEKVFSVSSYVGQIMYYFLNIRSSS